jgi:hypothetical protein
VKPIDAAVLVLLAGRHYGYYHVPTAMQAGLYSVLASLLIVAFLLSSSLYVPLKAWAMGEEAMSAGCTTLWMTNPWESSGELCSDIIGVKLGVIGVLWLALALRSSCSSVQVTESQK